MEKERAKTKCTKLNKAKMREICVAVGASLAVWFSAPLSPFERSA